jgi:hypothetical protein
MQIIVLHRRLSDPNSRALDLFEYSIQRWGIDTGPP